MCTASPFLLYGTYNELGLRGSNINAPMNECDGGVCLGFGIQTYLIVYITSVPYDPSIPPPSNFNTKYPT